MDYKKVLEGQIEKLQELQSKGLGVEVTKFNNVVDNAVKIAEEISQLCQAADKLRPTM